MQIIFDTFDNGYKWRNVIRTLSSEHRVEEPESKFQDWLYAKYQIKYIMSTHINGIEGLEFPDDMHTFLAIKFNIS